MAEIDMVPTDAPRTRRNSLRAWVSVAIVGALLILSLAGWVLYYMFGRPAWETQSLETTLLSGGNPASAVDDTQRLCMIVDCEEGWQTRFGDYLVFRTEGRADYWEQALGGDIVRNGRILLDRSGLALTPKDRAFSVDLLFPGRDWD